MRDSMVLKNTEEVTAELMAKVTDAVNLEVVLEFNRMVNELKSLGFEGGFVPSDLVGHIRIILKDDKKIITVLTNNNGVTGSITDRPFGRMQVESNSTIEGVRKFLKLD